MLIFIINLDQRPDRMAFMRKQLDQQGLEYRRITAVDGLGDDDIGYPADHPRLTKGEFACYLSHLQAYRALLDSDARNCLVLEDDGFFADDFAQTIKQKELSSHQNAVVRLEIPFDCTRDRKVRFHLFRKAITSNCTLERVAGQTESSGAYIISRKIAARVLSEYAEPKIPIDVLLFVNKLGSPAIKVLQVVPPKAIQTCFVAHLAGTPEAQSQLEDLRSQRIKRQPKAQHEKHPFVVRTLRRRWKNFKGNTNSIYRGIAGLFFKEKMLVFDETRLNNNKK